jgi:acyl-CoA dehydrogenase
MTSPITRRYDLPFFDDAHRQFAHDLDAWCATALAHVDHGADDAGCRLAVRSLVKQLGAGGWLRAAVPEAFGGLRPALDSRLLVIAREVIAYHDGLADFAFAMQGLGSGTLSVAGSPEQQAAWLPKVARGEAIAAFALSEPQAGSDVGAMAMTATPTCSGYTLNGEKTWISNGGIADFYTLFARTDPEAKGAKGISAFIVPGDATGMTVAEHIEVVAPHPLATLRFVLCNIPATQRIGQEGEGFKLAMRNLDIFRASVAGAALGFARRALDAATAHARTRPMFGTTLANLQLSQAAIGDMATRIDAAALLTYRAAWLRDVQGQRTTREAAMAKLTATENAQWVIDRAVQFLGGLGVKKGQITESLYREIRALRIYEGATEVQQLIVGKDVLGDG